MSARRDILLLVFLLAGTAARAGLLDSPPPASTLESTSLLRVVYRMGAIYFDPGRVDTLVTCRNDGARPAEVAYEIFDQNDARAGALVARRVAPGGSIAFATSPGVGGDSGVVVAGLPPIAYGKARVSATTIELSCTGYWRARTADGTTKDSPLQLVKKVAFGANP